MCAEPLMLRCMKLLGIGMINAFALLAVIGDVGRFHHPEKLVAYIGLNPGQRQSGLGKKIKLGVGKHGRSDMRHLLIQGAQAVLRMGRNTYLLGQWGWKLFARKGNRNTAVTAVARKLLVQVWHLLSGNPPTALETDKSFTLKLHKLAVVLGASLRRELRLGDTLPDCIQDASKPNPSSCQYCAVKMNAPRQTGLMGAVRPQTPHRSPRQAFGGNFQYGLPAASAQKKGSTRKFCLRGYFVEAGRAQQKGTRASLPALVNPC